MRRFVILSACAFTLHACPAVERPWNSLDARARDVSEVDTEGAADIRAVDHFDGGVADVTDVSVVSDARDVSADRTSSEPHPECPAMPACEGSGVVRVSPTGGSGADASPYTGWETLPIGACRVEFPPGVYEVRRAVMLRSNLTIRCLSTAASAVTFRRASAPSPDGGSEELTVFTETGRGELRNVVVEGCTFDHQSATGLGSDLYVEANPGAPGIGVRTNLVVQNNRFINLRVPTAPVIDLRAGTEPGQSGCFTLRGNTFLGTQGGAIPAGDHAAVFVATGDHLLIDDNRSEDYFGFVVRGAAYESATPIRDLRVVDNVFERVGRIAIDLRSRPDVRDAPDGGCQLLATDAIRGGWDGVFIERNQIRASLAGGVYFTGSIRLGGAYTGGCGSSCYLYRPIRNVRIADNVLRGTTYGVDITPVDDVTLGCYSPRASGVPVTYAAQHVEIVNNRWNGTDPEGGITTPGRSPLVALRIDDLSVQGNQFFDAAYGVYVSGTRLRVTGNTLERLNQDRAPAFQNAGPEDACINVLGALAGHSDGLTAASSDVTIADNTCVGPLATIAAPLAGVRVDRAVSDVTVRANTISGERYRCGVFVNSGVTGLTETGTTRVPGTMPARCP